MTTTLRLVPDAVNAVVCAPDDGQRHYTVSI
jgi:hypothetical protein